MFVGLCVYVWVCISKCRIFSSINPYNRYMWKRTDATSIWMNDPHPLCFCIRIWTCAPHTYTYTHTHRKGAPQTTSRAVLAAFFLSLSFLSDWCNFFISTTVFVLHFNVTHQIQWKKISGENRRPEKEKRLFKKSSCASNILFISFWRSFLNISHQGKKPCIF